jgi:hypothetical protein
MLNFSDAVMQGWQRFGRTLFWTAVLVVVAVVATDITTGQIIVPSWIPVPIAMAVLLGLGKTARDKGGDPDSIVPGWVAKLPV